MASYRKINQALNGVQAAAASVSNVETHFLHKTLLEIGMRSRERDTKPQLFTASRYVNNVFVNQSVASVVAPVTVPSSQVQAVPSADLFKDLSQTPIKTNQFQPRPSFLRNDESPEQGYESTVRPRF